MTGSRPEFVIGVDAGGTKTTAWIASADGAASDGPLGAGQGGPGNPRAVGFEKATREIAAAIQAAWNDALNRNVVRTTADVLCLSAAGAGRSQEQDELRRWAMSQQLAGTVVITGDAQPILAAAAPDNVGIALISGTGSFAWARTAKGKHHRAGGWGYLLGDDGSGYAIAIAGLRAAVRAADGRAEPTSLLDALMHHLRVAKPSELIEAIYGTDRIRAQIADCADVVFATAPNDPVARCILEQAADDLGSLVTVVARRAEFSPGEFTLALAGGVLTHQPEFRANVVTRTDVDPGRAVVVPQPVAGTIAIARRATMHAKTISRNT